MSALVKQHVYKDEDGPCPHCGLRLQRYVRDFNDYIRAEITHDIPVCKPMLDEMEPTNERMG